METTLPEAQGFSSLRLARIGAVMERYVAEDKLAGIVTLVARRGQVVHLHKCGLAVRETGVPWRRIRSSASTP